MSAQGFLSKFEFGPKGIRRLLNFYPPFRGAGIHVREIAADFRTATVELRMKLFNRNYVGTHFGGSLYAMTDPFVMILMMQQLGRDYVVWDLAGAVRYLKPARGTVVAHIEMPEARVAEARERTADGARFEPVFQVDIVDQQGVVVAQVEKTLYIRKKRPTTETTEKAKA